MVLGMSRRRNPAWRALRGRFRSECHPQYRLGRCCYSRSFLGRRWMVLRRSTGQRTRDRDNQYCPRWTIGPQRKFWCPGYRQSAFSPIPDLRSDGITNGDSSTASALGVYTMLWNQGVLKKDGDRQALLLKTSATLEMVVLELARSQPSQNPPPRPSACWQRVACCSAAAARKCGRCFSVEVGF